MCESLTYITTYSTPALARVVRQHRGALLWIESTNTKIRVLTRIAYGFKSPEALIVLAMLALGGQGPDLPGQ